MAAKAKALDFSNVKDGGTFNKKHQAPGDYPATVVKVADAKSKKDDALMWLFTIKVGTGLYPYYCKLEENQLWKIRNLFTAAGMNVPKKRVNVDPNKVVGKKIGVTLEDEEYEGKMQSNVTATFPTSELEDPDLSDGEEDEDTETADSGADEDQADEPPKKKKSKKNKGGDSVEAPQGKKGKKSKAAKVDDVNDDELEELDIEDI